MAPDARIDLHTHSLVSDGTQTPTELVHAAAAAGLDVVGVTDHDTAAGWEETLAAGHAAGIEVLLGIEVSTRHRGHGVHLLAYGPDPTHPGLAATLRRIREGRGDRVPTMVARLRELGIDIGEDDVRAANPGTDVLGRPHVADALVALGAVRDRDQAFADLLDAGRPAFVDRWAAPLTDVVGLVAAAGGVSVVAHPWGRGSRQVLPADELAALAAAGLTGIEVDHQDHDEGARAALRDLAATTGLVATGASDHHGSGKVDHDLGCNLTAPREYERLLAALEDARRRG